MPFSAGLPLLSGLFPDRFIGLEVESYRILFLFFALKLKFED
ncbi:MAG: hypothetical protein R6V67_04020 [Spirochaetia bacterium]